MNDLVIRNGTVVNADWSGVADVTIRNGQVASVTVPGAAVVEAGATEVDAQGCYVMPGGVDPHCHVDNLVGEYRTLDSYEQATRAAVWGGTTTIIDFAIPEPHQTAPEAARSRIENISSAWCDVAIHGCVTDSSGCNQAELEELGDLGINTIKLFTTYRDTLMVNADTVYMVMEYLNSVNGLTYIHAESNHLIEAVHQRIDGQGEGMPASQHASTRPEYTETAAVEEILSTAENADLPVYFVHVSSPAASSAAHEARSRGGRVYTETCPHYVLLTDRKYSERHPERYVCCPPLRNSGSVDNLKNALAKGQIDTVGSDHNCFNTQQKLENSDDVRRMPNGLPGVEMRMPIMYSEFVNTGLISPSHYVALTSATPSRLAGLYPRKGTIAAGSDADIIIVDPDASSIVSADRLHETSDYTPYEGREICGAVRDVIVGGEVAIREHSWVGQSPHGKYLSRGEVQYL